MTDPRRTAAALGLAALGLALLPAPAARAAAYQFTDVNAPGAGATGTTVNGLSNAGVLVGFGGGNNTNFTFGPGGTFAALPALPNPPVAAAIANGINASGTVVGQYFDPFLVTRAFSLTAGGTLTTLPAVQTNQISSFAFGINDNGTIVGQFADGGGVLTPGFIDVGGAYTTISAPSAYAANGFTSVNVQGINDAGLAVGFFSDIGTGVSHGFTYDYTSKLFTTLADPVDPYAPANDFLFSQVLGVNAAGLAVGYFGTTNNALQHGFLYDTHTGVYTYLDDPNVVPGGSAVMQITGINNAGEIAGFYSDANNTLHGFQATPAVPESPAGPLLLLGLLPLGALAARRRRSHAG